MNKRAAALQARQQPGPLSQRLTFETFIPEPSHLPPDQRL